MEEMLEAYAAAVRAKDFDAFVDTSAPAGDEGRVQLRR